MRISSTQSYVLWKRGKKMPSWMIVLLVVLVCVSLLVARSKLKKWLNRTPEEVEVEKLSAAYDENIAMYLANMFCLEPVFNDTRHDGYFRANYDSDRLYRQARGLGLVGISRAVFYGGLDYEQRNYYCGGHFASAIACKCAYEGTNSGAGPEYDVVSRDSALRARKIVYTCCDDARVKRIAYLLKQELSPEVREQVVAEMRSLLAPYVEMLYEVRRDRIRRCDAIYEEQKRAAKEAREVLLAKEASIRESNDELALRSIGKFPRIRPKE